MIIVDLQCCANFCCTTKGPSHICIHIYIHICTHHIGIYTHSFSSFFSDYPKRLDIVSCVEQQDVLANPILRVIVCIYEPLNPPFIPRLRLGNPETILHVCASVSVSGIGSSGPYVRFHGSHIIGHLSLTPLGIKTSSCIHVAANGIVLFHCECAPLLLNPFICRWTFRLFPCLTYYEYEHARP